jgi:sporulation-control protein spo0M
MRCTYLMNSTKRLGVNTECIPTSFLKRRLGQLCIYSVKKHSGAAVEDTYPGYMTEMTRQVHGGQHIGSYYNKMTTEYPPEIESY